MLNGQTGVQLNNKRLLGLENWLNVDSFDISSSRVRYDESIGQGECKRYAYIQYRDIV